MKDLIEAIRDAWCSRTAAGGDPNTCRARPGVPFGQCAVTALVVQDYLDGTLLRCQFPDGTSHYWNHIPGIGEIDLTRDQYMTDLPIPRGVEVPRSRLLEGERAIAARTPERYALLRDRVRINLMSNRDPER